MCVAMVIIYTKTLEKKGVNDVRSKKTDLGLCQTQTMSQGTALFSCRLMETSRWRDLGRGCTMPQSPVGASLESLWDSLPEVRPSPAHWRHDATSGTISSLLQDLSLTEAAAASSTTSTTAPPSKRQCRSLSCSDELGGCRSAWRPQGSRVWTAVEKRRCHSGGSVQRSSLAGAAGGLHHAGFPAMQRSLSFSLPAHSDSLELPCFASPRPSATTAFTGHALLPSSSSSLSLSSEPPPPQPLYLSHEQICLLPEPPHHGPSSPPSSADSTPELERRSRGGQGGLARSRSQPCVLNHKKAGMKRRRPSDTHKQRPSLDLAKMTQKLRNFHSLSCPGITGEDCSPSNQPPSTLRSPLQCETALPPASGQALALPPRTKEAGLPGRAPPGSSPSIEDQDWTSRGDVREGTGKESLWVGLCSPRKDAYQLGGELDIDQIERN